MENYMANFQPLNKNKHQALKVKLDPSYSHSAQSHIVPISVFELPQTQAEYPIVFIKDSETGRFHLVALLGLRPQENLFHKKDDWNALYIPQYLSNYPFLLSASPEQPDNFVVGLDLDSDMVSETNGEALFSDNGEQTKYLTQVTENLARANSQLDATQNFIQTMVDKGLLSSQSLTIKPANNEEFNVTGLYSIDEVAFNELNDSDYQELKEKGFLTAIYSCLFSTQRIAKLIHLTDIKN
jgi:hypothetical protein